MWEKIQFTNSDKGQSICPICSHHRKPHHQRQKCLSWDKTTGIATCHHCGEKIFRDSEKEYKGYQETYVKPEPILYAPDLIGNPPEANNGLFKAISERYGEQATRATFDLYKVRTNGSKVIFHQADSNGIRYIKEVAYLPNGKRSKEIGSIRSLTPKSEGNYNQCLFGLHLYKPSKYIHIVESEKTAIVCHLEMPDKIWMATGGANNLNNVRVLKKAIIHPDLDKVKEWAEWAETNGYKIDRTIETLGLPPSSDLADAILRA